MKKKVISLFLSTIMMLGLFNGCSSSGDKNNDVLKVGMSTDAGTIDDKSFNQGAWEGIQQAKDEFHIEGRYLKPTGTTHADFIKEINNLYDADFKFMILPGFKFETAVYEAQEKYTDAKFVIIDAEPKATSESEGEVGKNTVAIFYAEEQGGFLAGVAAAVQLKEGDLGFIGGLEIPPVQRFNWGFQQGVEYANKNLGTNMSLKEENILYQGSFNQVEAGQQLAAQMYERNVKAIFTAAGGVGIGVINEAKSRAKNGEEAWVIGVDTDQYEDGIYEGNKSVILTSAIKGVKKSVYDMIKLELDGNFEGGKTLIYDVKNEGIGLPKTNPNLSEETMKKVDEVLEKIKNNTINVSNKKGNLLG